MSLCQKLGSVIAGLLLGLGIHSTIDATSPASLLNHTTHTATSNSASEQQELQESSYQNYLLKDDHPKMTYNSANGLTFPLTAAKLLAWQRTLDSPDRQQGRKVYVGWAEPGELFAVIHNDGYMSLATITAPITDTYGTHYFLASGHAFERIGEPIYATEKAHPIEYPVAHVVAFAHNATADVALVKMDTNRLCQLSWCYHGKFMNDNFYEAGINPIFVGDSLIIHPGYSYESSSNWSDILNRSLDVRVRNVDQDDELEGHDGRTRIMHHLVITNKVSIPGDSGSPVTDGGGFMVGMLEAGNDQDSVFVPIGNAMHQLRIISGIPSLHIASVPGGNSF